MTAMRWLISLKVEILADGDIADAERRLHFLELVHDLERIDTSSAKPVARDNEPGVGHEGAHESRPAAADRRRIRAETAVPPHTEPLRAKIVPAVAWVTGRLNRATLSRMMAPGLSPRTAARGQALQPARSSDIVM